MSTSSMVSVTPLVRHLPRERTKVVVSRSRQDLLSLSPRDDFRFAGTLAAISRASSPPGSVPRISRACA